MIFDYLIVGCGLTGIVLAERLATQLGKKILIIDRRDHIGGNCYDYYNDEGILVHKYGPHYFRTDLKHVFDYLSNFTEWNYLYYRIKVMVDGKLIPLPINLDTVNELYGCNFSSEDLSDFFMKKKVDVKDIRNSEDAIISKVGQELYEKIYRAYTLKQWGEDPRYLDASVCGRIPVRTNRDDRYFTEKYQAMPKYGFHRMFARMLDHEGIHIMLKTDYREIKDDISFKELIYTGPIDEFFDFKYGKLPYRSLRFEHETFDMEFFQPVPQVNYPYDYDFTRIVEIKHVTGQKHHKTTIVREYPVSEGEPYYPVPKPENEALYQKYRVEAGKLTGVYFIGRLAMYRYLNMDQVIDEALGVFESIKQAEEEKKRIISVDAIVDHKDRYKNRIIQRPTSLITIVMVIGGSNVQLVREVVESVLSNNLIPDVDILFIDNASHEDVHNYLKTIKGSRIVVNRNPRGCAENRNMVMEYSSSKYYLFLDSDVIAYDNGWLDKMIETAESDEDIAVVGGGTNSYGSFCWVNHYGFISYTYFLDKKTEDSPPFEAMVVQGHNMLVRGSIFKQLDGFDEGFRPVYGEDIDFCLRAVASGYRVMDTTVNIHHMGSAENKDRLGEDRTAILNIAAARRLAIKWSWILPGRPYSGYDSAISYVRFLKEMGPYILRALPDIPPTTDSNGDVHPLYVLRRDGAFAMVNNDVLKGYKECSI